MSATILKNGTLLLSALLLAACGGGGSSSNVEHATTGFDPSSDTSAKTGTTTNTSPGSIPPSGASSDSSTPVSSSNGGGSTGGSNAGSGSPTPPLQQPPSSSNASPPSTSNTPSDSAGGSGSTDTDKSPSLEGVQWSIRASADWPYGFLTDFDNQGRLIGYYSFPPGFTYTKPASWKYFHGIYLSGSGTGLATSQAYDYESNPSFLSDGSVLAWGGGGVFIYANGVYTFLPKGSLVANVSGDSAGYEADESSTSLQKTVAFAYYGGVKYPIPPLGDRNTVTAMNDAGDVLGHSFVNGVEHAFVFNRGQLKDLGALPGTEGSHAYAINNAGQVVGGSYTTKTENGTTVQVYRPFLYTNGSLQEIKGDLPQASCYALDINNLGQIVIACAGPWNTFLYSHGKTYRITDLPLTNDVGQWSFNARKINDRGQIYAEGRTVNNSNQTYTFVLTPVPPLQ